MVVSSSVLIVFMVLFLVGVVMFRKIVFSIRKISVSGGISMMMICCVSCDMMLVFIF